MKQLPAIIISSLLSSLLAIALYRYWEAPKTLIIRETVPSSYTSLESKMPMPVSIQSGNATKTAKSYPADFRGAAQMSRPAVVNISTFYEEPLGFWGGKRSISSGSGVIISPDGYIVTNHHVIEGGESFEVSLNNTGNYKARLVGADPSTDIALLQLQTNRQFPFISFGNSDSVQIGEWVLAVGNPFNLESTVTAGIVSAKGRSIDILEGAYKIESFIQTDAVVNPGNSGGALVNTNGELIGINTAIVTRSGRYEGYSFAVPANLVSKVVEDLKNFGTVQRAILGIRISDYTENKTEEENLSTKTGVRIEEVFSNSAADDGGLKKGDIIIQLNENRVYSIPELQEYVALFRPGDSLYVSFIRDGKPQSVIVQLKDLNNNQTAKLETAKKNNLGVSLRTLSENELQRLSISGGVMITNIQTGSLIAETNMDPGFIVTTIIDLGGSPQKERGRTKQYKIIDEEDLFEALESIGTGKVLLEGIYESYPGDWGYTFELK